MKIRFSKDRTSIRIDLEELLALTSGHELHEEFKIPGGSSFDWTLATGEGNRPAFERRGDSFHLVVPTLVAISLRERAVNAASKKELEAELPVSGGGISLEVDALSTRRRGAMGGDRASPSGRGGTS